MALIPCSPDEAQKLSELLAKDAHQQVHLEDVDFTVTESKDAAEAATKKRMGIASFLRTQYGAFGDEVSARALTKLAIGDTKGNNFVGRNFAAFNDAMRPLLGGGRVGSYVKEKFLGIPKELGTDMLTVMEGIGKGGKVLDETLGKQFSAEKIEAGVKIRKIFDDLFDELMLDPDTFIHGYVPLIKQRIQGMPGEAEIAFRGKLSAQQMKFVHELERTSWLKEGTEPDLSTVFAHYLHAAANAKIRKPVIEEIERDVINPYHNPRVEVTLSGNKNVVVNNAVGYRAWKELVHSVLGGVTEQDRRLADNLSRFSEAFGFKPVDTHGVYNVAHMASNAYYAGVMGSPLGGRPSSIIRQLFQIAPTIAEFGPRFSRLAVRDILADVTTGDRSLIGSIRDRGLMSSHIENLIASTDAARGVGKVISGTTDSFLKVFAATDGFMRAATARAADLRFNSFLEKDLIHKLPGRRDLKDEVRNLVRDGKVDQARDIYAVDAVNLLQYGYGKANKPQWMRGALGHLSGIFMSYPLNTMEMTRYFVKRAAAGAKESWSQGSLSAGAEDFMPLVRLVTLTGGMMYAGSEFLDADLTSAFAIGAMPHSMAFPKMALDSWQAGSSAVEWVNGNLYSTGESDWHKANRLQYWDQVKQIPFNFMPGYQSMNDLSKVIDENSLARMFALTPKGDAINEKYRQKRKDEATLDRLGLGEKDPRTKQVDNVNWNWR